MNSKLRLARAQVGASIAVLTLTMAYCLVQLPRLQETADRADAKAGQLQPQVQVLSENQQKLISGLGEANRRLIALGKTPVPTPTLVPSPHADGLNAEESAAVRLIVADQLSRQKVTITQVEISQIARVAAQMVPRPADGKTPTVAQIQPVVTAAVAAYCTGDKCVGKVGPVGPQGDRGPKGDKVTDEELLKAAQQALASYCGQESSPCAGKVGPSGMDGQDAPYLVDQDCIGDGDASYWRMQFNKGPDKTAKGPCRIGPEPEN